MAGVAKYAPINGGALFSDFKAHWLILKAKNTTVTIAYVFVFIFIVLAICIAFTPSSSSPSQWLTNLFTSGTPGTGSSRIGNESPYRSHLPSVYNYFFPNSRSIEPAQDDGSRDGVLPPPNLNEKNCVARKQTDDEDEASTPKPKNNITILPSQPSVDHTVKKQNRSEENRDKIAAEGEKGILVNNLNSSSLQKQQNNGGGDYDLIKSLMNCDFFDGNWVEDESYPLYNPGSCPLIDEQFNCFVNGRTDKNYYKLKWKPKDCTLPRLNGSHMLELLRGKRLVFVGDSLNRNMWESLICIMRNSVKDHKKVYEENGRRRFRGEASYSFVFEDYKCTVEFFVSPFLVQEWEVFGKDGTKKETLRLDIVSHSADKYKNADIIVFNTGHWWTHEKTVLGKNYYQEGSHVYTDLNVLEAFRKAITTWGRWVDANVDPNKSLVFFRGYSASHFSGGQWNSGGQCDHETEPIKNDTYLAQYPPKMIVLQKVLRNMKTPITFMNVTRMTDYRKDGHPSVFGKRNLTDEERRSRLSFQDCSHWCLPGVPDAWNEVLYAELLVKLKKSVG